MENKSSLSPLNLNLINNLNQVAKQQKESDPVASREIWHIFWDIFL